MGMVKQNKADKKAILSHTTKKCPECLTQLTLDAEECFSCKKKVGEVNKHGVAKRPINWSSNIVCILSWILFVIYLWWAFF